MVSSTQKDLEGERNALEHLLTDDFEFECLRAETYQARGLSSEDTCREMARDCDIYLGVFGTRYGFVPDHLGISVTDMEYQEARNDYAGKVLIYIKDPRRVEVDEAQSRFLERVQDFKDGYFRHERFHDTAQLIDQVRGDVRAWLTMQARLARKREREVQVLKNTVATLRTNMRVLGIEEDLV